MVGPPFTIAINLVTTTPISTVYGNYDYMWSGLLTNLYGGKNFVLIYIYNYVYIYVYNEDASIYRTITSPLCIPILLIDYIPVISPLHSKFDSSTHFT